MAPVLRRRALVGLLTAGAMALGALGGGTPAGADVTTTVGNPATISIPDSGNANPFPSTITASTVGGKITGLTVELTGVDHTCAKDLDILLVGPTGTKTTLLSDVGNTAVDIDCNDLKKTVIVSDSGVPFGTDIPGGNPITVRPSDNDAFPHQGDDWGAAGSEVAASNLAIFNGSNPNGQWKLYVKDDAGGDSGSIAGWKLNITTLNEAPTATNQSVDVHKGEAKAITLGGTDPDGDPLTCQPTLGATPKGTVSGSGCAVTYTANVRADAGGDSFGFRVRDSAGVQSGIGTVTVSIVNRNPVATNQAVSVPAGSSVALVLGGIDADPGESLALTCAPELGDTESGKGKVSGSGCNVTYKADPGTTGTDTFAFSVADGFGGLANGTVTVTIGPASLAGCADGDTAVQRYVCRVYLDMLGRAAEPEGKAYWVDRINSGQPRYEILNSFSRTSEYRVRAVRRIYTQLLGHDADAAGRTYWADQLKTKNPDVLRASLLGSPEFLSRAGGIDGWAPAMYQLVLRRPATPTEAKQAKDQVTTGGKTRSQVALALLATPAADTATVQSVYEGYLRRTPPPSEASFWVGRLQSGAFETRMVVEIVAGDEYYGQP
jgi:subtilisin-like proprotein convertase family protein